MVTLQSQTIVATLAMVTPSYGGHKSNNFSSFAPRRVCLSVRWASPFDEASRRRRRKSFETADSWYRTARSWLRCWQALRCQTYRQRRDMMMITWWRLGLRLDRNIFDGTIL